MFDLFTGQPAIDAAEKQRALLQKTQAGVIDRTGQTRDTAAGYLNTGFGDARTNLGAGYGAATGAIGAGAGSALGYLDQGTQGAVGALTANGGAYAPLSALAAKYGGGADLYADSLGINGAEGNTRAVGAYQAGPAFNATRDAGIDAINRRANAGGMLAGGNANRDAIQFAHDLSLKDYSGWQDRLGGYNNLQLGATQGAAAGNAGQNIAVANLLNTGGQNKAQIASGQGSSLADLASRYYGGMAGLDTGQAGALAGNATNATGMMNSADLNIAPQVGKTFQDEAAASLAGTKNLWGLGMGLATSAAGGLGGMGGMTSLFGGAGGIGGLGSAMAGGTGATNAIAPSASFLGNNWGW